MTMVMSATKTCESMYCSPTKSQNKAEHKIYDMLKALLCLSLAHPGTPLHFSFERQWTQGLRTTSTVALPSSTGASDSGWYSCPPGGFFSSPPSLPLSSPGGSDSLSFFFPFLSLPASSAVTALGPLPPHCVFQSSAPLGLIFVKRQSA